MKVIIIGGVAGGASCAARLRRLDENAEIVMVERGPYVSYAKCWPTWTSIFASLTETGYSRLKQGIIIC
jgi:flavin-dependent dehydrogenase